jgi:ATP phosphoribosyltransferase regulatory subunit
MRLEAAVPAEVLTAIRAPFLTMAATPLNAPTVLPLSLMLDLAGEALRERLFVVQEPGGAEACLRPDFTLAAVLGHLASGAASGRYFYEGPAFRVSPPGASRTEQFAQIGLEVFETGDTPLADADMACLAWTAASAGGREDLSLVLGDVALFGAFLTAIGVADPLAVRLNRAFANSGRLAQELALAGDTPILTQRRTRLMDLLAGLTEVDAAAVLDEIWALAGIEPVGGRSAAEIVHRLAGPSADNPALRLSKAQADMIGRYLAIADAPNDALAAIGEFAGAPGGPLSRALSDWERRLAALIAGGVRQDRMRFSAGFGRAFGYYDGMLFEVRSAALGEDEPVAAGGRYDGLPGRLGEPLATGAVGCMVRPGRAWRGGAT